MFVVLIFVRWYIGNQIKVVDYVSPYFIYDGNTYIMVLDEREEDYDLPKGIDSMRGRKIGSVVVQYHDENIKCDLYSYKRGNKILIVKKDNKYQYFIKK